MSEIDREYELLNKQIHDLSDQISSEDQLIIKTKGKIKHATNTLDTLMEAK